MATCVFWDFALNGKLSSHELRASVNTNRRVKTQLVFVFCPQMDQVAGVQMAVLSKIARTVRQFVAATI